MDVPPIHTARLELVSMTPEFMEALLAGRLAEAQKLLGAPLPAAPVDAAVEHFLGRRLAQLRQEPDVQRWLARVIVSKEKGRLMIGNVGFHGQPGVNAAGRRTRVPRRLQVERQLPSQRDLGLAEAARRVR